MAIEIHQDSQSPGMSPRISFSYYISPNDNVPVIEQQYIKSTSSSSIDFDFCVFRESFDRKSSSSADELFSNGKILPIEIKKRLPPLPPLLRPPQLPRPRSQELNTTKAEEESKKKAESDLSKPSFWRFKRSTSLKCGSGYARTLCPLPLLSRSTSTGTMGHSNNNNNNQKQKQFAVRSYSKQTAVCYYHQKPPMKKSCFANNYGNKGVKVNPVLNVTSVSLFGLGSMFSGASSDKNKKCA